MIRASINQIHLPGKGPPSQPTEGDHSALSQEGRMPLGMAAFLAARRVHPTELDAPRPIQDHALGPNSPHPNDDVSALSTEPGTKHPSPQGPQCCW